MTMEFLVDAVFFAAGYAAAVFTGPAVRTAAIGAAAEATKLRARAEALEAKIRGL
jgi:hypothetical protein